MSGPLRPDIAAKIARTADAVTERACRRCGAPVLAGLAGHVAALDVVADPTPLDPAAEIAALLEGRMTWCITTSPWTAPRVLWRDRWHASVPCPHHVVRDHRCPPQPVQETLL
ncbi:hypothetical protein [Streptomyces sp. NPDC088923]|uniref:hypothetical protein n=1 Tax=Streptomyces sp. NPDC088923 TaxID=3365913 RepID=UPI0038124A92